MLQCKEVSILSKRGAGRRSAPYRPRCADHVVAALTADLRRHTDQPGAGGLDHGVPSSAPHAAVRLLPGSPVAAAKPAAGSRPAPPQAPIGTRSSAPDRMPLPIAPRWPTGSPSPTPALDTRHPAPQRWRRPARCRPGSPVPGTEPPGPAPGRCRPVPRSAAPWLLPADRRSATRSAPDCPRPPGPAPPARRDHPGRDGGARSPPGAAAVDQVPATMQAYALPTVGGFRSGLARGRRHRPNSISRLSVVMYAAVRAAS
jgi:hypothetical protein